MADGEGNAENLEIRYNVDRILDCHTHLTGMKGESAESILECMDFCGVKKIFSSPRCSTFRTARSPVTTWTTYAQ